MSGYNSNRNPETTNWAEHKSQADISTGKRFKAIQEIPMTIRTRENGDFIYIGESMPGITEAQGFWRIKRVECNASITKVLFANGNDNFINTWASCASLAYT